MSKSEVKSTPEFNIDTCVVYIIGTHIVVN